MVIYYINGWRESEHYFFSLGNFTDAEINKMEAGNIVSKNGNDFWFIVEN